MFLKKGIASIIEDKNGSEYALQLVHFLGRSDFYKDLLLMV